MLLWTILFTCQFLCALAEWLLVTNATQKGIGPQGSDV